MALACSSPTTIFNSVASFMTNTNLQHYSGDQHLSNWSQIFFVILNQYVSAAVGFCALTAIIRCFRAEKTVGNFFVDMWRVVVYMFVPVAFVIGILFMQQGMPMTYQATHQVSTLEPAAMGTADNGQAKQQTIVVGPVAAVIPIKMLGTNGGGFYGMNSAHPMENPTAWTNFLTTFAMMFFPFSLVLMYGRMLNRRRHAWVIFSVMFVLMAGTIVWSIYYDTLKPNPGLTAHPRVRSLRYRVQPRQAENSLLRFPRSRGFPVDQHLGNLEGKELRFGTSAGATFAAVTVDVTCGAVNCEHDSLNPIAALSPMWGMWVNCILRRQGRGHDQPAAVPDHRGVPGRPDGGAHARVPGQENRCERDETRGNRTAGPSPDDFGADGDFCGHRLGDQGGNQPRGTWLF